MIHAINYNARRPKITFQLKPTIYRLHDKNAYSDEKKPKRRKRERERNEERDRKGKNKKVKGK